MFAISIETKRGFCYTCSKSSKTLTHICNTLEDSPESVIKTLKICIPEIEWKDFWMICNTCKKTVENMYNFREMCLKSEYTQNKARKDISEVAEDIYSYSEVEEIIVIPETHTCGECNYQTESIDLFLQHMKSPNCEPEINQLKCSTEQETKETTLQPQTKKFICGLCMDIFPNKVNYREHMIRIHGKIISGIKSSISETKQNFGKQEEIIQNPSESHSETLTNNQEDTENTMKIDENPKKPIKPFKHITNENATKQKRATEFLCKLCPAIFTDSQQHKQHVLSSHQTPKTQIKPFKCSISKSDEKSGKNEEITNNPSESHSVTINNNQEHTVKAIAIPKIPETHTCGECNYETDSIDLFLQHMKSPCEPEIKRLKCSTVEETKEGTLQQQTKNTEHIIGIQRKLISEIKPFESSASKSNEKCGKQERVAENQSESHSEALTKNQENAIKIDAKSKTVIKPFKRITNANPTKQKRTTEFLCKLCPATFPDSQQYKQHVSSSHQTPITPIECSTSKSDEKSGKKEITKNPSESYSEALTNNQRHTVNTITIHKNPINPFKRITIENPTKRKQRSDFICKLCSAIFPNMQQYTHHITSSHQTTQMKSYKCSTCDKLFTTPAGRAAHEHVCEHCKRPFTSHWNPKAHELVHDVTYVCGTCGGRFDCEKRLRKHIVLRHTDRRVYAHGCEVCGKRFERRSVLVAHMARHTGEKPFKCVVCERSFATGDELKQHRAAHESVVSMLACELCDMVYRRARGLDLHLAKVHGVENAKKAEKRFFCEGCGNGFNYRYELKRHTCSKK